MTVDEPANAPGVGDAADASHRASEGGKRSALYLARLTGRRYLSDRALAPLRAAVDAAPGVAQGYYRVCHCPDYAPEANETGFVIDEITACGRYRRTLPRPRKERS
jgi:hypothetical protein